MPAACIICHDKNRAAEDFSKTASLKHAVHIWCVELIAEPAKIQKAIQLLSAAERETASRFFRPQDQLSFISRRAALRLLLAHYLHLETGKIDFSSGNNKKPFSPQARQAGIAFNLSHSGNYALIAFANTEIGVDIEKIELGFSYQEILKFSFSEAEQAAVNRAANPTETFYTLWTRKEALAKAASVGIDEQLAEIPCLDGRHHINANLLQSDSDWELSSFKFDAAYASSIAHHPSLLPRLFKFNAAAELKFSW